MTVQVVTTLHQDGYNLYGKDYIKSWEAYFPRDWIIDYYAEDHDPVFSDRVNIINFKETCTLWQDFYDFIKLRTQTITDKKELNKYRKALRWSFKMFTLLHALENPKARYVIWMDSDVYCTKSPSSNWIQDMMNGCCIAGQLEFVKGFPHVETGFLPIDTKHPDINKVINWIKQGYIERKILGEPKPWDGAWIGKLFDSNTVSCKKIRMMIHDKGDKQSVARAFSNESLLWLTHKVGDGKFNEDYSGRSGRKKSSELI